jgi:SH3-like domain-containing protein
MGKRPSFPLWAALLVLASLPALLLVPGNAARAADNPSAQQRKGSGLPIPRFASLRSDEVNVRTGPGTRYPVDWVFKRKGMPVEIVAEFENWRRIRDSEGEEGWILQNMLTGKRTAMIAPWKPGQTIPLHDRPEVSAALVAKVSAGVVGEIESCNGEWCEITAGGYDGWAEQSQLWGVYPGEAVD